MTAAIYRFFLLLWTSINNTVFYLWRGFSALAGAVILPVIKFYELTSAMIGISLGVAIVSIPLLSMFAGTMMYSYHPNLGIIGAIGVTFIAAAALIGLAAGLIPAVYLLNVVKILFNTPVEGARIGWNEGLISVVSYISEIISPSSPLSSSLFDQVIGLENATYVRISGIFMAETLSLDEIIQNLANADVQAARRPMTAEQFAALELSELEYH